MMNVGNSYGYSGQPYPPQYGGYQGYGPAPTAYGGDAYNNGYASGMQGASPYANQVASSGDSLTGMATGLFGAINGIFGGVSDLLGGLVNSVSGIFGGGGATAAAYPQQGYYPQQAYNQQVYFQNVPPAPPGGNDMAIFQAKAGDLNRQIAPQQGLEMIAMDCRAATEHRSQCEDMLRRAETDLRSALSAAQRAASRGDSAGMADARAKQEDAFNTWRQAGELALAVHQDVASAQITYNILFGPAGRMRGADGNNALPFLQQAHVQWEGGRDTSRWFSPTINPPYQHFMQVQQEMDQGFQRIQQLYGAGTLARR